MTEPTTPTGKRLWTRGEAIDSKPFGEPPVRHYIVTYAEIAAIEREAAEATEKVVRGNILTLELQVTAAEAGAERLAEALRRIERELGQPSPEYAAPVANAKDIAREALRQHEAPSDD